MAATGAQRIRKTLYTIHQWTGVCLFVLLIPLCLSGLVLMWPDAVNNLTNPPPKVESGTVGQPLASFVDAARSALPPTYRVQTLHAPQAPGEAVTVAGSAGRASQTVWLDPGSAKVLKVGSPQSALWQVSHAFHETLTLGQPGRPLVGVLGVAMLYFSLSGLWLWWRRGAVLQGFAWRRTPSTLMNLHYLGGFWIAIPLAVVALTGIGLAFPQQTAQLLGAPQAGPRPPGAPAGGGPDRGERGPGAPRGFGGPGGPAQAALTPDQAVASALALHPGASLVTVVLPGQRVFGPPVPAPAGVSTTRSWRVLIKDGGAMRNVWVADADAAAVDAPPAPPRPPGGATFLVRQVHEGEGGPIWNALVALTGVIPVLLAVTGVWTFLRNLARRRAAKG
jgi:uncharacterized iron-regulated membrane protein